VGRERAGPPARRDDEEVLGGRHERAHLRLVVRLDGAGQPIGAPEMGDGILSVLEQELPISFLPQPPCAIVRMCSRR